MPVPPKWQEVWESVSLLFKAVITAVNLEQAHGEYPHKAPDPQADGNKYQFTHQ